MRALPETDWKPYVNTQEGKPDKPTDKQWAEVPFAPEQRSPKKDAKPFRYVGNRIPRPEPDLFKCAYMYFRAVVVSW